MTQTNLRLTIFQVQRLQDIVGLGGISPYQITIFTGDSLGRTGTIVDPSKLESANDGCWLAETAPSESWLRRFKFSFGMRQN